MFLLSKVDDLLKSVSAFGADQVVPHSGSCGTQTVLMICALTLVADDQRSAPRAMIANFTVIVSGTPPELKQRFKGLVAAHLGQSLREEYVKHKELGYAFSSRPLQPDRGAKDLFSEHVGKDYRCIVTVL